MSIKTDLRHSGWHCLQRGGVITLSGVDALPFAQAQFANDVKALGDGQWHWNCWLSAKGRVIALFALIRLDAHTLTLWLPDHPTEAFAERLSRMRFRSKLDITPQSDAIVMGALATPASRHSDAHADQAQVVHACDGQWRHITLDLGASHARALAIHATPEDVPDASPSFLAQWAEQDILHGLPRLGSQHVEAFTPQMLGLERLAAFSVTKGCYPGQEVVARTHFLGQAKRGLIRLSSTVPLHPGMALHGANEQHAQVITACSHGEQHLALAVATIGDETTWQSEDELTQATTQALGDGLARPSQTAR